MAIEWWKKNTWKQLQDILPSNMIPGLVNVYITMENHHAINGKTHYKLPFSIAFCMFTRGYSVHGTRHLTIKIVHGGFFHEQNVGKPMPAAIRDGFEHGTHKNDGLGIVTVELSESRIT